MSTPARFIPTVLTLALAFSFNAERAAAQAMISYGHGVAKAAGAGAAVGGGVGGILTGLKNPLAAAADRRGGPSKGSVAVRRETVPVRRGGVAWDVPQQGFGAPAPLPLVGGVQASGVNEANWQPTLLEPSQNLAVISASWGGPGVAEAEAAAEAPAAEEPAVEVQTETPAEPKQKLPVVLASSRQGGGPGGQFPAQQPAAAPANVPEGIAVGTSVEELLKRLGRPYLSFRGVAGEGYTDQYVFQLPGGGHLVVYVLDGIVAHLDIA